MGETFAHDISDKAFISRIYKERLKINDKKNKNKFRHEQSTRIRMSPKKIHNVQEAHGKMLNVINHQGNENQYHITSHPLGSLSLI